MTARVPTRPIDAEVAELLSGRSELLAFADAVATTQAPPPRRPHRRAGRRVVAVAVTAALIAGVALVAPWHGEGMSVTQRALAAVGGRPVLHAVIDASVPGLTVVNVRSGATRPVKQTQEFWLDSARQRVRLKNSVEGQVRFDYVANPLTGEFPEANPALVTFIALYRQALAGGKAHETGRGTVAGRPVIWLTMGFDTRYGQSHLRVAIDASTYRPVLIQQLDAAGKPEPLTWRVLTIGALRRKPADFAMPPPRCDRSYESGPAGSVALSRAARATGWTPLWLGRSFGGLKLVSVEKFKATGTTCGQITRETGLQLTYGRERPPGGFIIEETRALPPAPDFRVGRTPVVPPPGSAIVSTLPVSLLGACNALVRVGRIWVTVTALNNDDCAAAARAVVAVGSPLVNRPASPIRTVESAPTAAPPGARLSPAECTAAWNRTAPASQRSAVASTHPLSAFVDPAWSGAFSTGFGGTLESTNAHANCTIEFFLSQHVVIRVFGSWRDAAAPTWQGPPPLRPLPTQTPAIAIANASVSADGTLHMR